MCNTGNQQASSRQTQRRNPLPERRDTEDELGRGGPLAPPPRSLSAAPRRSLTGPGAGAGPPVTDSKRRQHSGEAAQGRPRAFPRPCERDHGGGGTECGEGGGRASAAAAAARCCRCSASPAAAPSPGAPLGCQKKAATCSGAESLLAARREGRAAAPLPVPGTLPLLSPPGENCRRLPASEGGENAAPVRCATEEPLQRAAPPLPPGPAAGRRDDGAPRRLPLLLPPPAAPAAALPPARNPLPAAR